MQFHSPSVVQAVPAAIALPVPVVLEDDEAVALATGATEDASTEVAAATDVAAAELAAAEVTKTPPDNGVEEAAAEVATAVSEPPAVGDAPETTAAQDPVGVESAEEVAVPSCSTESPGAGKSRSVESTVPQPLPMLATNMSGKAS